MGFTPTSIAELTPSWRSWGAQEKKRLLQRLQERQASLNVSASSPQALEIARCSADVVYWVNTYGKTFDPREAESTLPFRLFPKQADFLRWLAEREKHEEGGLVEKSRDMGLTWLCCAYALHGWLFRNGYNVGFGSRKLELVDKIGDLDSILEKIRFHLRNLPEWMQPAGFKWNEHDNFCRLLNPANGSAITGEGGDNIGRGGRKSIYFVDEAAFLEHPQKVDASLSQTTRVRIDVSTPNGPGNPFATKRHSGKVAVFTFHWRDDPRKDDAWYARQKDLLDLVTVAQEIDIDYSASVEGITIPARWVRAAVNLELPTSGPVTAGLDVAAGGKSKNVLIARRGPVVTEIMAWVQSLTTQTAWKAAEEAARLKVSTLHYDCVGVGQGVQGVFDASETPLPFMAHALNSGEAPSTTTWPDGKSSKERFINLRAELWWLLRARFEATYEYVELGIKHAPETMISIPNHPELIAQLSLPLSMRTETGKIKLESKADMRKRGVASPDFADALVYTFAPAYLLETDDELHASFWGTNAA